ncbi:MAG TPA: DNA translocase FtsK [Verrucomicrobiae bacterium]
MSEFIYVLENSSMPGLVKIGRTERSVSERVSELSSHTGVPTGFVVIKEYAVTNSVEAERIIHDRLSDYRVADNREFFKMEAEDATDIIESMLETATSKTRRDFEREDELVARAIPIVAAEGMARTRMLEERLGISYQEALVVIQTLRGRGVIGQHNESRFTASSKPPIIMQKPDPITVAATPLIGNYWLPPMDFLQHADMTAKPTESKEELMANARLMQQTLAQFDIEVALGDITKGPTITRYELHPAPDVKLEEISALSNNLAAALKAENINILTPIPGKSSVGVEVPNQVKTKVIMRDLFESDEWRNTKARIPIALGKDFYGHSLVADLSEMPHLLLAGSTGSGKSVCIDSIIASLLYRFSPDQLRFVMIDTKVVELQRYNALPHLVVPVVTDPKKVVLALRWVINEIEKRYQLFMRVGAHNLKSFNERPNKKPVTQEPELPREEDIIIPEKLSYIVVIIDDLADLMLVAPADMEMAITRITQLARPAGIHCIIATQRPSVDFITSAIKAEIPARIAFRCASRLESRLIIEATGAEKLLGNGDSLYLPPDSTKLFRIQGALITDRETQSVVDFIAKQARPSYEMEIHKQLSKAWSNESVIDEDEELVQQCIEVICSEQKASVPLLQRRLRLGYGRAARIMDELENRGIVGPSKGAEPRDILIDLDASNYTPPIEQPLIIAQTNLVVCLCEHCSEKIEFDANELGDRQTVSVSCPHCGIETNLSPAQSE